MLSITKFGAPFFLQYLRGSVFLEACFLWACFNAVQGIFLLPISSNLTLNLSWDNSTTSSEACKDVWCTASPVVIAIRGVIGHETLEDFWVLAGLGISTICEILEPSCKIAGTCLYRAFLEGRFSFAASTSITKPVGFKLQWDKCSLTCWDSELDDRVPCCPGGLSPQLGTFCEFRGFSVAFHFSNAGNVVASGFGADAFEVRETGALILDPDLKGCKLRGRALLNFGLIWLPASRDPETWPLRGSLIDGKMGANWTVWDVDRHNVEVGASYGFSRHTKVVDRAASTILFGLLKTGNTWCKWAWQSLSTGLWEDSKLRVELGFQSLKNNLCWFIFSCESFWFPLLVTSNNESFPPCKQHRTPQNAWWLLSS